MSCRTHHREWKLGTASSSNHSPSSSIARLSIAFTGAYALNLVASTVAFATLVLGDGGHYIVSAISEDISLENGTSMEVVGGVVTRAPDGIAIRGSRPGEINVGRNGVVAGDIVGDWQHEDLIEITDNGVVTGSITNGGFYWDGPAGSGVSVSDTGTVLGGIRSGNITVSGDAYIRGGEGNAGIDTCCGSGARGIWLNGGTIQGSDGGAGINHTEPEVFNLRMHDGSVVGGHGAAGIQCNYARSYDYGCSGVISGGSVLGGAEGGDAMAGTTSALSISSGHLAGASGGAYGGDAIDTSMAYHGTLSITGGAFDAGFGTEHDGYLMRAIFSAFGGLGTIDISGGQWGYGNYGRGFLFGDDFFRSSGYGSSVSFNGWDLEIENGYLTGLLLDGSWIEAPIAFSENWEGTFSLNNHPVSVPEPGTLSLLAFALCIAGLSIHRHRRIPAV